MFSFAYAKEYTQDYNNGLTISRADDLYCSLDLCYAINATINTTPPGNCTCDINGSDIDVNKIIGYNLNLTKAPAAGYDPANAVILQNPDILGSGCYWWMGIGENPIYRFCTEFVDFGYKLRMNHHDIENLSRIYNSDSNLTVQTPNTIFRGRVWVNGTELRVGQNTTIFNESGIYTTDNMFMARGSYIEFGHGQGASSQFYQNISSGVMSLTPGNLIFHNKGIADWIGSTSYGFASSAYITNQGSMQMLYTGNNHTLEFGSNVSINDGLSVSGITQTNDLNVAKGSMVLSNSIPISKVTIKVTPSLGEQTFTFPMSFGTDDVVTAKTLQTISGLKSFSNSKTYFADQTCMLSDVTTCIDYDNHIISIKPDGVQMAKFDEGVNDKIRLDDYVGINTNADTSYSLITADDIKPSNAMVVSGTIITYEFKDYATLLDDQFIGRTLIEANGTAVQPCDGQIMGLSIDVSRSPRTWTTYPCYTPCVEGADATTCCDELTTCLSDNLYYNMSYRTRADTCIFSQGTPIRVQVNNWDSTGSSRTAQHLTATVHTMCTSDWGVDAIDK